LKLVLIGGNDWTASSKKTPQMGAVEITMQPPSLPL